MTIPSSGLIQEIMLYEKTLHGGFCSSPRLNKLGMPCIGYGFPLWEEALSILHGNSKLAKSIKSSLPNEQENISLGIKRLLASPYTVSEKTAQTLLEQSLLFYAEELGKQYAGFRHLVNKCANSIILAEGSLARYEIYVRIRSGKLLMENGRKTAEKNRSIKKQALKKLDNVIDEETKENNIVAEKNGYLAQNANAFASGNILSDLSMHTSASGRAVHPAFLASSYSGFDTVCIPKDKTKSAFGKKRAKNNVLFLTEEEKALLRADSVLFLAHLLGLDMTSRMQSFFSALLRDDYNLAASELLSHSASSYLGAVMQMLARRIRDASIDYQDMFIASVQPAKFLLHRKKAKSYMLRYYIPKKNESGQSHILK